MWRATRQIRLADRFQQLLRDRGNDGPTRAIAPILSMLQSAVPSDDAHGHMPTWNLPEKASSDRDKRRPTGAVALSLANLVRLGCILPFADYGGPLTTAFVSMTGLGRAFVAACTHSHPDNQRPHERP